MVNPTGLGGGLAVSWTDEVSLYVELASSEAIDLMCTENDIKKHMRITFVHATTVCRERLHLWEELQRVTQTRSLGFAWVILNENLYPWKKIGRWMAGNCKLAAFLDFINDCSLMDLECKGSTFTWVNNKDGDDHVKERLDRSPCNVEWRVIFPSAEVYALATIGTDQPLVGITLVRIRLKAKGIQI